MVIALYEAAAAQGLIWQPPHVTASPRGEAVLEWWGAHKKLTVYVDAAKVEYVLSWGPDIEAEMADGEADTVEGALGLWHWLIAG